LHDLRTSDDTRFSGRIAPQACREPKDSQECNIKDLAQKSNADVPSWNYFEYDEPATIPAERALAVASGSSGSTPKYLAELLHSGSLTGLRDGELLARFSARPDARDKTAELAFATLLARHGPMVMRVCRTSLRNHDAAEDAFQATFLVLASRAGTIRRTEALAAWLHGVALRVSAR
jgi:hypothetical protein